ncbi:hypothetical protein N656DRAFT_790158 [Canariomyces notabilis]|uniref:Uncharacterized protein n=1 Tax=Canariomyces notabilis TaxID=2074819 RepID=A0AAN6TCV4_9PEZI|nr:hypothetical protein N656DRAFT_790158 [Canariomyces arenarius]
MGSPLWLEGEDPSPIEVADRKVMQLRFLEAIQEREQLDETNPVNTQPRSANPSLHRAAIQQRVDLLRATLQTSRFPPERANIEAAIAGYESGAIPYSDAYTLIWAGRIVDRCPSFASFAADRAERLDRYLAEHGPGWLWYEPPLAGGGAAPILVKKAICLENHPAWRAISEEMGHYRVTLGFRRRKEWVAREGEGGEEWEGGERGEGGEGGFTTASRYATRRVRHRRPPMTADPSGPRIFWPTLLDSGATLPCLWEADILLLQIDLDTYAAQSVRTVSTAESVQQSRVYDLDVAVCPPLTPPAFVSVIYPHPPGHEDDEEYEPVSHITPVVAFPGQARSDYTGDEYSPDRLSGLLPFHSCYVSGAPGSYRLWLGKDRRDVLGAGRMPGQMRFPEHTPSRVVFEHEFLDGNMIRRVLRDEDDARRGSRIIVSGPRGFRPDRLDPAAEGGQVNHFDSRKARKQRRRQRRRAQD